MIEQRVSNASMRQCVKGKIGFDARVTQMQTGMKKEPTPTNN